MPHLMFCACCETENCHFYATFTGPDRKKEAPGGCFLCSFSVFPGYPGKGSFLLESVFAQTAGGADPIRRDLLPGGSGGDAVLGIAYRGIIDVAAGANILIHDSSFFRSIRSSASAGPRKPCRDGPRREPSHRLADGQAASRPMGILVSSGFPAFSPLPHATFHHKFL